ncbi:MAG: tetratricopeptide repeat protein [Bacteroidota bacterium]|nr:tetratricopeptide repeat protein [Bacteroidota bacterium]
MEFYDKLKLDDLFYEADNKIKERNFADAMQTLEAILAEAPEYGKAYNHLAWLYDTKYRNLNKAEENYKMCLLYEPEYAPVYLNYAAVLSTMNKWKELEELLIKALDVPGVDKASIYNEYGIMYELRGNYNEAVKKFKEAIRYTLVNANLETYKLSIKRCEMKKEIL